MNLLDVVIIVLLLTGIGLGVQRGFLRTSLDLVVLVTAAYAGATLYRPIRDQITSVVDVEGASTNAFALVIGALGVLLLLNLLIAWTVSPHLSAVRVSSAIRMADTGLGAIPGFVYGLLFAAMMTLTLGLVPLGDSVDRALADSNMARQLRVGATSVTTGLAQRTGMDLADFTYVVVPESNQDVSYRIPPANSEDINYHEGYEAEIANLVNEERVERGVSSLSYDPELVPVARGHSHEMVELGYFSHTSPNTGTLVDRLRDYGVDYVQAGENLAYAPSVSVAHRGLMQSDGHRRNILDPGFERIGVGVVVAPDGTLMVTQVFAR